MVNSRIQIVYVTHSPFKAEENKILVERCTLKDGTSVGDVFEFNIRQVPISELLEVDIVVMVQEEVIKAFSQIKIPCIVEHAGLIFDNYSAQSYPGGLTKPMWNTLQNKFIDETNSAGRRATARAVVAYCDGVSVKTFVGESKGKLAESPRGSREFYWDTVFVPDDPTGKASDKTYAEIVDDHGLGLEYKVTQLSQSTKAMLEFLEYRRNHELPEFW